MPAHLCNLILSQLPLRLPGTGWGAHLTPPEMGPCPEALSLYFQGPRPGKPPTAPPPRTGARFPAGQHGQGSSGLDTPRQGVWALCLCGGGGETEAQGDQPAHSRPQSSRAWGLGLSHLRLCLHPPKPVFLLPLGERRTLLQLGTCPGTETPPDPGVREFP